MPEEKIATLNEGLDSSAMQQLDPQGNPGGDDVLSTIGDEVGGIDISSGGTNAQPEKDLGEKEAEKEGAEKEVAGGKDPAKDEKAASEGEKGEPFHKHPDWQRMLKQRDEAVQELKDLKERVAKFETATGEKGVTSELLNMSDEDLAELIEDGPKVFVKQLIESVTGEVERKLQTAREAATQDEYGKQIDATYDAFGKEHPDFLDKWNEGTLQEFMEANPGHTPISAYLALERDVFKKSVQENLRKEIEDTVRREYRAKIHSDVLGDGPASSPQDGDDELKHAEKHGGTIAVQVKRLQRLRAQQ